MNPVESMTKNFLTYLAKNVPDLKSTLGEWPAANAKLDMPSASLFANQPKFTNCQVYELSRTAPDANKKVFSTMVVGEYDLTMQLDLWCRNKAEREKIFGLVFEAINKTVLPMGLSLPLPDYFGEIARFDVDGYQFVDDESSAQRQEWRVRISLLGNVRALKKITNYGMITFDKQISTPNNIPG
jgi:hypothetical protein